MLKTNFQFDARDFTAVLQDGQSYDLHNTFDFTGFAHDVAGRVVRLTWIRAPEAWVPPGLAATLRLTFTGVTALRVHPRQPDSDPGDDSCLEFLGYVHPDFAERISAFVSEDMLGGRMADQHPETFPVTVGFVGGQVIVVQADAVSMTVGPDLDGGAT